MAGKIGKARPGDVVLARLVEQQDGSLKGEIEEIMGSEGDPALDTQLLIHEGGIRHEWSKAVLQAASKIPTEVDPDEIATRVDLREQPCFTIDGKESRDLDDAIYVEKLPRGGIRLWVHIADVSHYVRPGDTIDEEALLRGTSVYFPDRVIPMLPVGLSNGICSLNPGVDRFALTARMDFTKAGKRKDFKLMSTVIRSHHRLNYEEVHNACIEKDPDTRDSLEKVLPDLELAFQLSDALKAQRNKAGYLDFHLPEVYVKVNELGEPIDIKPKPDNKAYGLIEQFMVSANEAVSDWMVEADKDFVFRVHDVPDPTKLQELEETARRFGVRTPKLATDSPAQALQKFLAAIDGRPDQDTLRIMTLRCMKLAEYTPDNKGHFGLGSKAYTHFTSPIRRYPDLLVHRLLKDRAKILNLGKKQRHQLIDNLSELCKECSRLERQAESAEREAIRLKKLHFLEAHKDEIFEARVNGVANFGLFFELEGVGAEGLMHISQISHEYLHYDQANKELTGNESGRVYRLGTRMTVRAESVNLRERRAYLVPAQGESTFPPPEIAPPPSKRPPKKPKKPTKKAKRRKGDPAPQPKNPETASNRSTKKKSPAKKSPAKKKSPAPKKTSPKNKSATAETPKKKKPMRVPRTKRKASKKRAKK